MSAPRRGVRGQSGLHRAVIILLALVVLPAAVGLFGFLGTLFASLAFFSPSNDVVPAYNIGGPFYGGLAGGAVGLGVGAALLWFRGRR